LICLVCGNQCDNDAPEEQWLHHFAPSPVDQGWTCLRCKNAIDKDEAWYFSLAEFREDVEQMGMESV